MIILLVGAISLMVWSLQLMKTAHQAKEASLIFAGVLVAVSAMGLIAVYFLMGDCIGYLMDDSALAAQSLFVPMGTVSVGICR